MKELDARGLACPAPVLQIKATLEQEDLNSVMVIVDKEYEAAGLHILVCGTCLNHFNLLERKQVGEITNMLDIVTSMQLADKVISI